MGHGRSRRGPVPVLLAGRAGHYIPRPDDAQWPAPSLYESAPTRDDQPLAERVRVSVTTLSDGPSIAVFDGGSQFRFRAVAERMGTGTGNRAVA
jgi:hypothetical protein